MGENQAKNVSLNRETQVFLPLFLSVAESAVGVEVVVGTISLSFLPVSFPFPDTRTSHYNLTLFLSQDRVSLIPAVS